MPSSEPSKEVDELAYRVIGAAIEVHKVLGPGYLENIYEEALCIELLHLQIPFLRQHEIGVTYKGEIIGKGRLDILVKNSLIVELKSVETLLPLHQAQVLSYLKTTGYQLGLLLNFNVTNMRNGIKRVILSY